MLPCGNVLGGWLDREVDLGMEGLGKPGYTLVFGFFVISGDQGDLGGGVTNQQQSMSVKVADDPPESTQSGEINHFKIW